MTAMAQHFDVAVVGSGPAGSSAAAILAASGAKVALIDKATFPRDKACGDLIGPRAVALCTEFGLALPQSRRVVTDMTLVGPNGNRLKLPAQAGESYPGMGLLIRRRDFDLALFDHAKARGAESVTARLEHVELAGTRYALTLSHGAPIQADAIIGADGASSQTGRDLGLVDESRSRFGFAIRTYIQAKGDTPVISLFGENSTLFPGYGWLFPDIDGFSNVGVGVGVLADRRGAPRATSALGGYLELLGRQGWLHSGTSATTKKLGGWLKMGSAGVNPAAGRAFLVGDAAALVNPLQGEGIFAAMDSGRAAADSLIRGGQDPATTYKSHLRGLYLDFAPATSVLQRLALEHPKAAYIAANLLTSRFTPPIVGSAWGIYWNDLMEGSGKIRGSSLARTLATFMSVATRLSSERRLLESALD